MTSLGDATGPFDVDCVIIGVNARSTLDRCIRSVKESRYDRGELRIVYVDGGSRDESVAIARRHEDARVVALDLESPTPGRGRNAGWKEGRAPFVFFLDSDTVADPDWIEKGISVLAGDPRAGAVKGNRLEMHPEASVFNWIGSLEWNAPPGESEAFGGDVLLRREVLEETGGYDEILVAGEDPELSRRASVKGWKIVQLDEPMTLHDLGMKTVGQYWKRAYRTGYGYAAVTARHGAGAGARGFWVYECGRIGVRGGGFLLLTYLGILGSFGHAAALFLWIPGLALLLYPRLFRVPYFSRDKGIDEAAAKTYAWHCSLVVIPEFLGMMRFLWGKVFRRPLKNKGKGLSTRITRAAAAGWLLLCGPCLHQCSFVNPVPTQGPPPPSMSFAPVPKKPGARFATNDKVREFSGSVSDRYLLGPGDVLDLTVWNRPEISASDLVVAPDGGLCVARIGCLDVKDRSVQEVVGEIARKLSRFYQDPEVTLHVKEYKNNKAFVLGRVSNPGVVHFPGEGTLLEALALAGGLPAVATKDAFLTRCSIIRGKDKIIWVDLRDLLNNGNMALNARIRNNDIIFIPESEDALVYVMGEVVNAGVVRLKPELTYMDALMSAGGPAENADLEKTFLLRFDGQKGHVRRINLKEMLQTADFKQNYMLQDDDVIYVAGSKMARFNYVMRQLIPSLQVLDLGTSTLDRFGVMEQIRKGLFGDTSGGADDPSDAGQVQPTDPLDAGGE